MGNFRGSPCPTGLARKFIVELIQSVIAGVILSVIVDLIRKRVPPRDLTYPTMQVK